MITLYRKKNNELADSIENRFEELTLAYRVEMMPESDPYDWMIEDGDKKIKTKGDLESWLLQLEKELNWQRSLSGDACYIDPETGEVC